jgi:hypothetical protein
VLTDVAGRADDFCLADIVVLDKNDLEQIANILVVVHDIANLVNEMDDGLCHPVSRRSLATED